ncbi:MAG: acylphosphatase [Salinibacterium sp.]|nr:acylphosphatase [Salinibacterium sp.]
MSDSIPSSACCRRQVVYSGRVQGVGFRATASDIARGFQVTGWVRNEPDGTVHLEAQGTPDEVESFLREVRRRQDRLLAEVRTGDVPVVDEEAGFRITRSASGF